MLDGLLGPRRSGLQGVRVLGQPVVVVAANLREEGEVARVDAKAREGSDCDRARELRNAGRLAGVRSRGLLDEAVCRQEVEVAGPPRPSLQ